ncbi:unnamed protein product [Didymodactylos carnosus]|uniref:Uncharacterized protein n=1 Tax=Didymodactylos carnosus TaxID=1234261 RepID=A0A8S2P230_9BILA|nr:unnamed protein product [Didymodactylos carnosus]CAF4032380.1 unnamed protein product [Didymodactylos carnosus]
MTSHDNIETNSTSFTNVTSKFESREESSDEEMSWPTPPPSEDLKETRTIQRTRVKQKIPRARNDEIWVYEKSV